MEGLQIGLKLKTVISICFLMMTIQAVFENPRKIKYDERTSVIHHPPLKDDHRYHGTFLLEALFYIVENCIQYTVVNGFVSLVLCVEYMLQVLKFSAPPLLMVGT